MFELLRGVSGVRLTNDEYDEDADSCLARASTYDRWKLERRQHFVEPWDESWQALSRGAWDEVLRIEDDRAAETIAAMRSDIQHGTRPLRVRVVELPLTPYLHWEMYAFRSQVDGGELIRVVGPEALAPFEQDGPVPELVNIGTDTLYEILYDDDGLSTGAVRYTGTDLVTHYASFMEPLYAQGEDFTEFFHREVAPLPPPIVAAEAPTPRE